MTASKSLTFPAAMKDFFGLRSGQTLQDFMAEIRALDQSDRAYFKKGLEQNGYIVTSTPGVVA